VPTKFRALQFVTLTILRLVVAPLVASAADQPLQYNRDIRPILADNCFPCHGPDSAACKAELRLDRAADATAIRDGMAAIVKGKPNESELLTRITSTDLNEIMPLPPRDRLKPAQVELLKRWIAEGANYEPHWSLIAPKRPTPLAVKQPAWVRNPIDQFVLARLEQAGLQPAPEADRRALARRVSLDLIGLPPAPETVDAFVNDKSADAYEKLVDQLLASKHWGEHRGRYWLDASRYADTHGIHFDNYREIWSYRDWVINAFNRNLPFDQFTIEQLAGDLLPNRTLDQQVASGFNRCNITTNEGGAIAEEYLVHYTRDRTETVSQVWLGTTAGCCTCHDHKFDPLSQREFYEMAAFFNNSTQAAMDGNIPNTPPTLVVPQPEDRPRWDLLTGEIAAAKQQIEARKQAARPEFDTWLAKATVADLGAALPQTGLTLHASLNEGQGKTAKFVIDGQPRDVALSDKVGWQPGIGGSKALQTQGGAACEIADAGDFDKQQGFTCAAWVKIAPNDTQGAIAARMDNANAYRGWDFWVQQRRVGTHIVDAWPDNAVKVVGKAQLKANEWTHVAVTYDGSGKAAGVKVYYDGKSQETLVESDKLQANASIKTAVPFKIGQRHTSEPLTNAGLQDLRLYKRGLSAAEVESLAKTSRFAGILAKAADQRTEAEKNEVFPWWLGTFDKSYQDLGTKVSVLDQEQNTIKSRGSIAHVMNERSEEAMAYILFRGEYDKRRDPVKPGTPKMLPPLPADLPRNRLGFAQWLLRDEHPLTTRVTVNRFWQELFGTGLVRTAGDFGVAGELSSHPELLDWMAVEFRESGWDIMKFFKLLVTSATYRQAAVTTPEKLQRDPQNRLLSRGPRFRMDAEMVRDYALAASGLLAPKLGGPSVKPYQPDGVWEAVAIIGSNTRDYKRDTGENIYRRSLYTFIKRSAPPASMEIFNATARETCTVRRERTNTPLQALVTLNDVQFVEAARHLAQAAIKSADGFDARADFVAKRLLARPFRTAEQSVVQASFTDLLTYYQAHADDAKQLIAVGDSKPDASLDAATLAAWTMLTNELMNLDEVLNK
jgi:hypothetical protein